MIRVATSTKLDVTITSLQSKMRLSPIAMTMIPQQSYRNTHCHEAANAGGYSSSCSIDLNVSVTLMVMAVTDTIVMYNGRILPISCEDGRKTGVI